MNETRPIPGYPRYEITEDGRVFSYKTLKWMKIGKRGEYSAVMLHPPGKLIPIHHLVLITYVGPRPEGLIGLHKDDNQDNNHFSNLEWGTHKMNGEHRVLNGRTYRGPSGSLSNNVVRDIRRRFDNGQSSLLISLDLGISTEFVRRIGKRISYKYVLDC